MGQHTRRRDLSIDIARIVAIIMVVMGHSLWLSNLYSNQTAHLIFHFFFSSVSIFFLLSGYSLAMNMKHQKQETTSNILHKTFRKLVIPLLIWGGIYMVWTFIYYYSIYPVVFDRKVSFSVLDLILLKYRGFHLWFIISLILFYLLHWYLKQEDRYKKTSYLAFSFVFSLVFVCIQYLQYYYDAIYFLEFTPFAYVFFFVWGLWSYDRRDYFRNLSKSSTAFRVISWFIFLLGIGLIVIETLFSPIGVSNVRISIFVFSIGLFLLFQILTFTILEDKGWLDLEMEQIKENYLFRSIYHLSQAIAGVYFIHVIILDLLNLSFVLLSISLESAIVIFLIAGLNPIISFVLVILLKRITPT